MISSPSLTPRQILMGMSLECSSLRKQLFELALYDTPVLANNNYIEAMKHLHDAALELSHLRVVASPNAIGILARDLPDLDAVLNRL